MASGIQKEVIESEIRTTGGKQVQDDLIKVNRAIKDLAQEEKNLLFIKNKLESQGKKNTEEWKKNETALKSNREATARNREELTKLNSQMKISEMTFSQLSKRAAELRGKMNNIVKELEPEKWNKYNRELGQVNTQMGKVRAGSSQTGGTLGKLGGALKAAGIAGLTFGAALKVGEAILKSAGASADKFEEVMSSIKTTLSTVGKLLATLDFSHFFKNIKEAWQGGKQYAQTLDEIEEKTRSLQMAEADSRRYILERQQILRSQLKDDKARIQAADEIITKENELAAMRAAIQKEAYDAEIKKFLIGKSLTKEQVENYNRTGTAAKNVLKEIGKGTDEELNKIVQIYDAWQQADSSALENTLRTKARRDSLLAQDAKSSTEPGGADDSEAIKTAKAALYARLTEMAKQYQDSQLSELDQELTNIKDRYAKEIDAVKKAAEDKIINAEEAANAIAQIEGIRDQEIAIKRADAEAKMAEESLTAEKKLAEDKRKIAEDFEKDRLAFLEEFQGMSADELQKREIDNLTNLRDKILANDSLTNEMRLEIEEAFQEGKAEIDRKFKEEGLEELKKYFAAAEALTTTFSNIASTLQDTEMINLEADYDRKIELAGNNKTEVARLEEEKEKKVKEIKKKYADKTFALQVMQIIASTALGIMQGYAQLGPILGSIMAVFTGILGAAQIAKASAERNKAKSLFTGGYSGDGGKYEVAGTLPSGDTFHRGEYVTAQEELAVPEVRSFISNVIEPMRMRRLGYSSYAQSTTLPGRADGGFSGSGQTTISTQSLNFMQATMERQNILLNKLLTEGVNSNFDQTKIFEMRQQISKQEAMDARAAR